MSQAEIVTAFVALFVVIDPIGLAPLFIALTRGMTAEARNRVGLRAVVVAFAILAAFSVGGQGLLRVIGIGIPAFRISGGILLFLIAIDMLFERRSERREKRSTDPAVMPDPSVFPLARPLIAGPGTLTTLVLLVSRHGSDPVSLLTINLVVVGLLGLTFLLFRLGGYVERLLGHTGIVVITRLLAILLAALSVQFVLDGLREAGLPAG